jgi:hypothetical protein
MNIEWPAPGSAEKFGRSSCPTAVFLKGEPCGCRGIHCCEDVGHAICVSRPEGAVEERVTSIARLLIAGGEHIIDCGTVPTMGRRDKEKTDAEHYVLNKSHC